MSCMCFTRHTCGWPAAAACSTQVHLEPSACCLAALPRPLSAHRHHCCSLVCAVVDPRTRRRAKSQVLRAGPTKRLCVQLVVLMCCGLVWHCILCCVELLLVSVLLSQPAFSPGVCLAAGASCKAAACVPVAYCGWLSHPKPLCTSTNAPGVAGTLNIMAACLLLISACC